ncbi:SRPBCC family protein (plasmid) [Spirosoma sp. SC4-14]|uniref:SRPBCC family protein n=1 Tax=Spirosoma sp. SC4-14 TaxID=3128900 RepID=UPI0030D45DC1
MSKAIIISGNRVVKTTIENAYQSLIDPAKQVKWNTLYLEATIEPKGEIKDGSVMPGNFKGSGKASVTFQNVQPTKEFTHFSKIKMFNFFNIGEFHHTYKVEDKSGQTEITQTVSFEPKSLGLILKSVIVNNFKKRLPESFDEFQKYVEVSNS